MIPHTLMPHTIHRLTYYRTLLYLCAAGAVTLPCSGHAQQIPSDEIQQAVYDELTALTAHRVGVSPAMVTVDPKTRTASVELQNQSPDTLDAELTVGNTPPAAFFDAPPTVTPPGQGASSPRGANGASTGGADSAAFATTEIAASHSLAPWVRGLPSHVRLAPGEKKTITVKLDVPTSRAAGEYAAWLVVTTNVDTTGTAKNTKGEVRKVTFEEADGRPLRPQSGARLVYKAE